MLNKNKTVHKEQYKLEQKSFLLMLVLVTVLFFFLLKPFFGALLWACIISVLFYPVYLRFSRRLGNHPNVAALMTLFLCLLIGIVPLLLVFGAFIQQSSNFYILLESGELKIGDYISPVREAFPAAQQLLQHLHLDTNNFTEHFSNAVMATSRVIAKNAVGIGLGALEWSVSFFLMLYMTFFMLRDGTKIIALLQSAIPLRHTQQRLLLAKFVEMMRATIKGNFVVAIIQGTLGGIIFWLIDIRAPLLWGGVMAFLSLIPILGAAIIWVPVALYLFATGQWEQGIVLAVFGSVIIGLIDNLLRPLLVGRDTKLPDYIVLLSILGGLVLFGINGFIIGPLLAALFVAFWGIFMREFNGQHIEETNEIKK